MPPPVPILRKTPLVCPKCNSTLIATLTPVTKKPKFLSCPDCDWILDCNKQPPSASANPGPKGARPNQGTPDAK